MRIFIYLFSLFVMLQTSVSAQEADTLIISDSIRHSPTKATIFSLVLPGLGQAYNKKYWKVPLAWAVIATPLYIALDQQSQFKEFKEAYVKRVDDDPNTVDTKYDGVYTDGNLLTLIDEHRKNRDLFFALTGIGYAIQVLDAAVDAHLFYFDVTDELVGNFRPSFYYSAPLQQVTPLLTLNLKFAKKNRNQFYRADYVFN